MVLFRIQSLRLPNMHLSEVIHQLMLRMDKNDLKYHVLLDHKHIIIFQP